MENGEGVTQDPSSLEGVFSVPPLARVAGTAERHKAVDQAKRETSKFKREMREEWETLVPAEAATPRKLQIGEGTRVRLKGIRDIARVRRVLGETGIRILVRIMGLLLVALAMQFFVNGLTDLGVIARQ